MSTSNMDDNVHTLNKMVVMLSDKLPNNLLLKLQTAFNEHCTTTPNNVEPGLQIPTVFTETPTSKKEYETFLNANQDYMSYMLLKREDTFFKLTRCERLSTLYDQCLNKTPPYVPQKWRKTKFHLLSREEYDKLHESEIQAFKSE